MWHEKRVTEGAVTMRPVAHDPEPLRDISDHVAKAGAVDQ